MSTLKCQTLLDNLHQKKYHFFNDDDIIRMFINKNDKEWNALTLTKALLQFYIDNPNSGIPYDKELLEDDRMMEYYDNLYYRIARNRSKMLSLSPMMLEKVYEEATGKTFDKDNLKQHPFTWIVGVLYLAWVILLFIAPGNQSAFMTLMIALFGAPCFLLSLICCYSFIHFVIIGLYDLYLEGQNYICLRSHRKSEYGKLEKMQADYLAARLALSKNC